MGKYSGIVAAILLAFLGVAVSQQLTYDERCQILESGNIRVDQCSSEKFLACKDGRCQCADPVNQIYTYREELITTRNKRSPKGGKGFKKVAVGAVAGAATYHVVSQASKGYKGTTEAPKKYQRVYACYSRVGGQCALNYGNVQILGSSSTTTTTSSTTTEAATTVPSSNSTAENTTVSDSSTVSPGNATTTSTSAPVAAAQTQPLDISKIPGCIEHAVCKTGSPSQGNGTSSSFLQKVDYDPRLGTCTCNDGYERTSKDICVKVKRNSATEKTVASTVIIAALLFNKMFAF